MLLPSKVGVAPNPLGILVEPDFVSVSQRLQIIDIAA
jgi:hypothetical protein